MKRRGIDFEARRSIGFKRDAARHVATKAPHALNRINLEFTAIIGEKSISV